MLPTPTFPNRIAISLPSGGRLVWGVPVLAAALFILPSHRAAGAERKEDRPARPALYKVDRGEVVRTLVERGVLEPTNTADVVCRVKTGTPALPNVRIKWLVDDGSFVKKGDKLVEFEDAALQDLLRAQQVVVERRRAEFTKAETTLKLAQGTGQRDVARARGVKEIAELNLKGHQSQRALQEKKAKAMVLRAEAALELAKSESTKAENERQARAAVQIAEANLELARLDLKAHAEAGAAEKRKLELEVGVAEHDLAITAAKVVGATKRAEALLRAAKAELEAGQIKLDRLKEDVTRCVIHAPRDGLAIYHFPEQARGLRTGQRIVAAGETAIEGQLLMQVTDLTAMRVRFRAHEAVVSRLRKGQPATVRLDAFPKRVLKGQVSSIDTIAVPLDWYSDVRVYPATVTLKDRVAGWKPGMSAEVAIIIDRLENVLRVPLQAVVQGQGEPAYCLMRTDKGLEKRQVTTGLAGNHHVEIKEGLREGEQVVLAPWAVAPREGGARGPENPWATTIIVRSVKPPEDDERPRRSFVADYGLTREDFDRFRQLATVAQAVPVRVFPQEVRHLKRTAVIPVMGTVPGYGRFLSSKAAAGRFLTDKDVEKVRNVAVLGAAAAKDLFPFADPLGKSVSIGKTLYEVVGVLEPARGGGDKELDRRILIPLSTCNARFGEVVYLRRTTTRTGEKVELHGILLTVKDLTKVAPTAEMVRKLLKRHHKRKDWKVITPDPPSEKE